MFKKGKMQYIIRTVSSEDTMPLQNLLNEMSEQGWDLYSMHEVESDDGFQFNCIFGREISEEGSQTFDEVFNISAFKSQMEKMLSAKLTPYETCKEIQAKIRAQKSKVAKIKSQLEKEDAGSDQRKSLNDKISAGIKELENLQHNLMKAISPDSMFSSMTQEKLSIHLSEEILEFVSPENKNDLLSETVKVRQNLVEDLGYVMPKIVFQDDELLESYEFSVRIRGLNVFNSFVYPNYLMFYKDSISLGKKVEDSYDGIDPISGAEIIWLPKEVAKDFWEEGISAAEYIAKAVEYCAIRYIDELFDYDDLNKYIDYVANRSEFLVENILPDVISLSELKYILVSLIREGVSIRDIVYIFEKINDFSDEATKDDLLDKLRLSLSRYIGARYTNENNVIQGIELSQKALDEIFDSAETAESIVRIDGVKIEKLVMKVINFIKENEIEEPVLVVPMEIRHMTYMIFSQYISDISVLAREEISGYYDFDSIGVIE